MTNIFIDSAAIKAVYDMADEFHIKGREYYNFIEKNNYKLIITNFVLDETYTLFRSHVGKIAAIKLHEVLISSLCISIIRISITDEAVAWSYFEKLPGRGVSFTDCTSFAVMKRLSLKQAFTFDKDFEKAGFDVVPL